MRTRLLPRFLPKHRISQTARRSFASPAAKPRPFSTVESCPSPTCACAPIPPFPEGLDIDYKTSLNGLIAGYEEQVLICTGQNDWASKIEEENAGDNLAADLKELFGRGGTYSDPFHNISILNSSFPSSIPPRADVQSTSAYLLPSFKYIPYLPRISFESVNALAKGYLLPKTLHSHHDGLSPIHRDRLTRDEATYAKLLPGVKDIDDVFVLICGHGGRDARCGILGPVLQKGFEDVLDGEGYDVQKGAVMIDHVETATQSIEGHVEAKKTAARVGLISHIGGHKFAGNVIIYLPPSLTTKEGDKHPLAGHGIWYGRIEPKHIEGVVQETVIKGNVVKDHFRGGIDSERRILRL